jgi:hypothetical protein
MWSPGLQQVLPVGLAPQYILGAGMSVRNLKNSELEVLRVFRAFLIEQLCEFAVAPVTGM